ncbi:hypothetical protein [Mycobacterium kyorinense]|uniref:hypothetical protein n=1 Tax=Mycobacterium kyorinense TaxID=487514 RepID=UPI0009E022AC|nr:hypothetical protein [Mycobacterium kyorinense]
MATFVAEVDRLLSRGHGLFPASGGDVGVGVSDGGGAVPPPPAGTGGLSDGVAAAGGEYERSRQAVSALDADSNQTAGQGSEVGQQGRAGAGVVRDTARAQASAIAPATNSPAGMKLMVSTMDERLSEMQRQVDTTKAQNRLLAMRLRQVAAAYQAASGAGGMGGRSPLAGMGGMPMMGGFPGGGGLSGLSGLAGLPGTLMSGLGSRAAGGAGAVPASLVGRSAGGVLGPGVANEKGLQKDTILAARAVSAAFPEIKTIGGVRPDSLKWHPNGQAIDVMIPDPTSPHGRALGDAVLKFALQHKGAFDINHIIWRQTMYNPDGSSQLMEDRGSPTQNHMDHVHIATNGGGYPRGGEVYRL